MGTKNRQNEQEDKITIQHHNFMAFNNTSWMSMCAGNKEEALKIANRELKPSTKNPLTVRAI